MVAIPGQSDVAGSAKPVTAFAGAEDPLTTGRETGSTSLVADERALRAIFMKAHCIATPQSDFNLLTEHQPSQLEK